MITSEPMTLNQRKAIFALCRTVGLDEEDRHNLQFSLTGHRSCKNISKSGAAKVINHLKRTLGRPIGKLGKDKLLGKIEQQLKAAGRDYRYGDALAKKICKIDKLCWLNERQLQKIIAALYYDAKRHGRRTK